MNISSGAQILVNSGNLINSSNKRMQNSTLSGAVGHRIGVLSFDDIISENQLKIEEVTAENSKITNMRFNGHATFS